MQAFLNTFYMGEAYDDLLRCDVTKKLQHLGLNCLVIQLCISIQIAAVCEDLVILQHSVLIAVEYPPW